MIRVTYDSEDMSGRLDCSFCGKSYELGGNVRVYTDANSVSRTNPDARLKVYSHFHYDQNAWIEECPEVGKVRNDVWEAVDANTGNVVARGRVVVPQYEHTIAPIRVEQDDPPV